MYRAVSELLEPQRFLMLWLAASLAWFWWRRPDERRRLLVILAPFCLFWMASLPATAHVTSSLLQRGYHPLPARPATDHCIVVLSGYALPRDSQRPEPVLGEDTLYRCLHAVELYRRGPRCPIVVSGGLVDPAADMPPLAHQMRDFLIQLGVAQSDVLIEDRSTTTFENASNCAALLSDKGCRSVVLVTDALHMLRSQRCFSHAGMQVVPAPSRLQNARFEWSPSAFLPSAAAARTAGEVLHEVLGLAWYKLKRRIA